MNATTKIIETPFGKHKVVIKEWITGRDREYINDPMYKAVETKADLSGGKQAVKVGNIDVGSYINETKHRELEKFVVSIDEKNAHEVEGKTLSNVEYILDCMHEDDVDFIKNEIDAVSKKKETPTI